MSRVLQLVVMIGGFSGIGCAHYTPKEHTVAEVYQTEVHAREVALSRMSYSEDLDTARVARQMVAENAK